MVVGIGQAIRRDDEPFPVGGPCRGPVVPFTPREGPQLTRCDLEDVDMEPRFRQESLAILLVMEPRHVPKRRRLRIFLVGLGLGRILRGDRAREMSRFGRIVRTIGERQLRAVRGPREPADHPVEIGQPFRFASLERKPVNLRLLIPAIRHERDRLPVRTPRGAPVLVLAERETARLAAPHRNEPEVRFIRVLFGIDRANLVDDAAPIGRERDTVDELEIEQGLGRNRASFGHGLSPLDYLLPFLNRLICSFKY